MRQQHRKRFWAVLICLVLCASFTALGAARKKTIQSVYLYITSYIEAGTQNDYVNVECQSRHCYVDEVEVTNVPKDEWESDDKPRLKITLWADDDYSFDSGIGKSKIQLSGDTGNVTSVSRNGKGKLTVVVTLDDLDGYDGEHMLGIDSLEWDETTGYGYWEGADEAARYEVRLFRNDAEVTGSRVKTSKTYYDFAPRLTRNGYYTFKVRAVYREDEKGDWKTSERWYVSSAAAAELSDGKAILPENDGTNSPSSKLPKGPGDVLDSETNTGEWKQDDFGWWYVRSDHTYPVNEWSNISGKWYYFGEEGYMKTGWICLDGKWYYLDKESGAMYENTVTPDGYAVGSDGAWIP